MLLATILAASLSFANETIAQTAERVVSSSSAQAVAQDDSYVRVKTVDYLAKDIYWVVGSHSADLYTTAWALHRCGACFEGNPLGPTSEARIALKMAGVASTGLTLWKLRRDKKNKAANILRWAVVAVNTGLVINNTIRAVRRK